MLRIIKILLILSVAAWGLLGAFGNFIDWSGTSGAVSATTSMSTFEGGAQSWRATTNPMLIMAGAISIPLLKILSAAMCLAGARQMWGARTADASTFQTAKSLALTGCAIAIFMLFTGWIVIAETWFELWRSDAMSSSALNTAFRYAGLIGVIGLFVAVRED